MTGYDALRTGAAWRNVSPRGKIRVTGEDRARLLHAMTTNDVKDLAPGRGCYAFFLSAQGRVLADVNIFCRDDDLLLDTEPETGAKVYEHLDKFIIADDVTLEDITGATATIAVEGPQAAGVLANAGATVPSADRAHTAWGNWMLARAGLIAPEGFLVIAPASERAAVIQALHGVVEADDQAARVIRIENGKPRYGEDITERFLTQETGQMQAVSFSKGCYLGQEIVERVRSRAQIHRLLMPLAVDSPTAPPPATKFQAAGRDAAEVTSSAYSPALGHAVALAYVRIDVKPGDSLTAGDLHATVLREPAAQLEERESCR